MFLFLLSVFFSYFSIQLKPTLSSTFCDDTEECYGDTINDDYVYCYGYRGCYTATIDCTISCYCDGYQGCTHGDITASSDVSCDSEFSCYSGTITSSNSVSCDGKYGCYRGEVTSTNAVTCDGEWSCYYANITSSLLNVYCTGKYGCYGASADAHYDIYCNGENGCSYSTLTSNDEIYCDGHFGCAYNTEITAGNDVYCDGENGCYLTDILSSDNTICNGDYACYYSNIYDTNRVISYGLRGTSYASIYTDGIDTFYYFLGGYYAGYGADLECAEDSSCYVWCYGDTACYGLDMYCYGSCIYTCDEDCYSCPTIYDYSSADELTKLKWDKQREAKKQLRKKHKNDFTQFNNDILKPMENNLDSLSKSLVNKNKNEHHSNQLNKQALDEMNTEKEIKKKLESFNEIVKNDLKMWDNMYHKNRNDVGDEKENNNLNVIPTFSQNKIIGNNNNNNNNNMYEVIILILSI